MENNVSSFKLARLRKLLLAAIAVVYLWHIPTYAGFDSSNEFSRLYLSIALARDFRVHIDPEIVEFGDIIDKSTYHQLYFSDKAPLSSIIALFPTQFSIVSLKALGVDYTRENLLTLVRYLTFIPLSLIFFSLFIRSLVEIGIDESTALAGCGILALATPFAIYSTLFYGHVMAGWALFGAWAVSAIPEKPWPVAIGILCGMAIGIEYPLAIASGVILASAASGFILTKDFKSLAKMVVGLLIPLSIVALINYSSFDNPLSTGYVHKSLPLDASVHAKGFMGFTFPTMESIYGLLLSPSRGLLYSAPILLFAVFGAARLGSIREHRVRALASAGIAALAHIALSLCFVDWQAGWSYSARHIVPVIPLLIPFIALSLKYGGKLERVFAIAAALYSAIFTVLAMGTFPHVPTSLINPARELFVRLVSDNVFTGSFLTFIRAPGWLSFGLFAVILIATVIYLLKRFTSAFGVVIALVVAAAFFSAALVPGGEYGLRQKLAMGQVYLAMDSPENASPEYEDIFRSSENDLDMRLFAGTQLIEIYRATNNEKKLNDTALELHRLLLLKRSK